MNEEQLKKLLERLHNGTATIQERKTLADWYSSLDKTSEPYYANSQERRQELNSLLANIHQRIEGSTGLQRNRRKLPAVQWSAAASVLIMVALSVFLLYQNDKPKSKVIVQSMSRNDSLPATRQVIIAATGSDRVITLPDSSTVKLEKHSTISYEVPFPKNKRDVFLKGKAFFKVAREKQRPFTVYAGKTSTTALGTSFTVKELKGKVLVKLITGKVMVRAESNDSLVLLPGQESAFNTYNNTLTVTTFRKSHKTSKPSGSSNSEQLAFRNIPLDQVLEQLKNHYKCRIHYDSTEIRGLYFSGSVLRNDRLPLILHVIGQMHQLSISEAAGAYTVRKK